jgi:predicted amidohydrolase
LHTSLPAGYDDYADVCCFVYDELDDDAVREHGARWLVDKSVQSNALGVAYDITEGRETPQRVLVRAKNARDATREFEVLRGLDLALGRVNPVLRDTAPTPPSLVELEIRLRRTGRMNTDGVAGALLPQLAHAREISTLSHKRDLLTFVRRVPESSWEQTDLHLLPGSKRLQVRDVRDGLDIACVPIIANPDEMRFDKRATDAGQAYRIGPRDLAGIRARIEKIVADLDDAGVQLAIAPELTLSPPLLEVWQSALRRRRCRQLRYVVAGTGNLDPVGVRAANTAVLLDGGTGVVIGRQPKLFGFSLSASILDQWKLTGRLGTEPLAEDLQPAAPRVSVFDLGAARMAILICEDLNKPLDLGPLIRDLGISLLIVPVFSRPLKTHRWEQTAAAVQVRETGTTVVVANSLVMATIMGATNPATSLVVPADGGAALLGQAGQAADLTRFRLHRDGSAEAL